ncbi:ATP-binding cassette domain-containing protein [Streptomyces sp. NPDC026673]|uniref:ATP-binding cassette domain-containing protein n=1 Tax=Streptomyces sp. NPDC026673 TaxID=3155724 RepID=UPI0033F78D4F
MITADGFGLKGPRGWVFRDVSFTAPAGALVAVEGPSGSGRTCLLLSLTGRMRATEGRAEVAGFRLPKQLAAVRRVAALGPVIGVAELDPALTVGEHLRERVLLQRRFGDSLRELIRPTGYDETRSASPRGWRRVAGGREAASRARVDEALAAAGLDLSALPKAERTAARDLERIEALRLGTALALLARPKVLAVDDADHKLGPAERDQAWEMLRGIAASGTTVLAVCSEAPADAVVVRTRGPAGTHAGTPRHGGEADADAAVGSDDENTDEEGAADAHAEAGRA